MRICLWCWWLVSATATSTYGQLCAGGCETSIEEKLPSLFGLYFFFLRPARKFEYVLDILDTGYRTAQLCECMRTVPFTLYNIFAKRSLLKQSNEKITNYYSFHDKIVSIIDILYAWRTDVSTKLTKFSVQNRKINTGTSWDSVRFRSEFLFPLIFFVSLKNVSLSVHGDLGIDIFLIWMFHRIDEDFSHCFHWLFGGWMKIKVIYLNFQFSLWFLLGWPKSEPLRLVLMLTCFFHILGDFLIRYT